MKKLVIFLLNLMLLWNPVPAHTGPKEDYEESYKLYIAAGASAAAYSDRIGQFANRYLEQDGWQIEHYVQPQGHTGARFLLAKKILTNGTPLYVIAIVGTENTRDIKTNLKVDRVYFAGNDAEEFAANAAKKNVPVTEPKVHRGFYEFMQAGLSTTLRNTQQPPLSLTDLLTADSSSRLYLTGHSLGGAAATLVGARLISMGVPPKQIEVITFGAPAVGNVAFATKFEPVLHLTRVVNSGDPVTGILQTLVGGYKQFGDEIKWNSPDIVDDPHKLAGYVDSAIKNYYDKRHQAIQAGVELPPPSATRQVNHGRIYIAPIQNNLPTNLAADFWYMHEALMDEYRQTLPDYVIGNPQASRNTWREAAANSGCQWAILSEVSAFRVKKDKNTYYVTVDQTVYDVATGAVANVATFSTGTYNLTPLEAFIHSFKGLSADLNAQFTK